MVSAPQIANEKRTEKINTIRTNLCNSALGVQDTLFCSSSNDSLI